MWGEWAERSGIPRLTFFGVAGRASSRAADAHLDVVPRCSGRTLDLRAARRQRLAAGGQDWRLPDDFYPGCRRRALRAVRDAGLRVGIAGNQPAGAERRWRRWASTLDLIGVLEQLGRGEARPGVLRRGSSRELGLPPGAIAYVGDRIDNDIRPAAAAGMVAIFLRRGPWAWIQAGREEVPEADLRRSTSLDDRCRRTSWRGRWHRAPSAGDAPDEAPIRRARRRPDQARGRGSGAGAGLPAVQEAERAASRLAVAVSAPAAHRRAGRRPGSGRRGRRSPR